MNKFSDFNIEIEDNAFVGDKIKMSRIINVEIIVFDFTIKDSTQKPGTKYMTMQIEFQKEKRIIFTSSAALMNALKQVKKEQLPFQTTIIKEDERLKFT